MEIFVNNNKNDYHNKMNASNAKLVEDTKKCGITKHNNQLITFLK